MAGDNNIKVFTAADIEKYHKGLLSPKERHDLEKAALDDPFLADALDGYATEGVKAGADIIELKQRLAEKTERAKIIPLPGSAKPFPWLRIAVVIVLIAGAGLLSYQFLFNNKSSDNLALSKDKNEQIKASDSVAKSLSNQQENTGTATVSSENKIDSNLSSITSGKQSAAQNNADLKTKEQIKLPSKEGVDDFITVETIPPSKSAEKESKADDSKAATGDVTVVRNDTTGYYKSRQATFNKPSVKDKDADGYADVLSEKNKAESNKATANGFAAVPAKRRESIAEQAFSNPTIFRGRVTDAYNNALPFANITNTVDNVGTYADAKGNFTLVSTDSVMNVQVRSVGFENNTVQLRGGTLENKISMDEDRSVAEKVLDSSKRNLARHVRNGNMTFEEPEPEDGWGPYDSYLANNVNIPDNFDIKKTGGSDVVEISFEVDKNGEAINIKVEKSLCDKCDKEAIRLIKEGPKWKRKARKGRTTVAVPFSR